MKKNETGRDSENDGPESTASALKRRVAHLGRLARRLLLLFLPLYGRHDLDLGRRPLLALLRLSPVEDTVAELDAVLRGKTLGGVAVVSFSEMTGCRGTVETRGEARDATVETRSNRP